MFKKCNNCEKEFHISPSQIDKRKSCSIKCKATLQLGKIAWNKGKKRTWNSPKFLKGNIPWNKNKKGLQTMSIETKEQMSKSHKGDKAYQWKGGITSQDKLQRIKFRRQIQKKVFKRDDYTCQICWKKGGDLQVDHIQSWAEFIDLRFDMKNCRTVCAQCHYLITFGYSMPKNIKGWGHNLLKGVTN